MIIIKTKFHPRNYNRKTLISGILSGVVAIFGFQQSADAAGTGPGGVDLLHVPISWCAVIGSPAQANPNLGGDTATDAILWRRHERPTDNIYINTAGITFRSSINNAWTVLDFPQIPDPDTTLATVGDMRGEDVNNFGVEYNALINSCDAAYTAIGRANIGVTAINAGLFHDGAGNYVTVVGWGGCTRPAGSTDSTCSMPYDGRIAVVDNVYMHPASPDRRWPGTNTVFTNTDPLDVLVGHELGHALGLGHVNNTNNLMNPGLTDNSGDGQIDNTALTTGQINTLRASAMTVPGLEIDPPLQVDPGDFIADRMMDGKDERELAPIADIASVKATLDKRTNRLYLSTQLMGPHEGKFENIPGTLWLTLDAEDFDEGATENAIQALGLDVPVLRGTDMVIRVDVQYPETRVTAWRWNGQRMLPFSNIFGELQTLVLHPLFAPADGVRPFFAEDAIVYDTIAVSLPAKLANVGLEKPFAVDAILQTPELDGFDRLDGNPRDRILVLEDPDFPHCFVLEPGDPGENAPVRVEGLLPKAPIHALIGPDIVAKGQTDAAGNIHLDLPIPDRTREGLHLVTVGVDDTALTADCVLQVGKPDRPEDDGKRGKKKRWTVDPRLEILKRNLDLMEKSIDLMSRMDMKKGH